MNIAVPGITIAAVKSNTRNEWRGPAPFLHASSHQAYTVMIPVLTDDLITFRRLGQALDIILTRQQLL